MRRKLIKQGLESCTLTLPKAWTQKHRLSVGDEVEIVERDAALVITPPHVAPPERSCTIRLPLRLYQTTLWHAVLSAYVAGYQEIVLLPMSDTCILIDRLDYAKSKVSLHAAIDEVVAVMVGMEVLVATKERVFIREVASGDPDQLDATINRAFYVLKLIIEESLQAFPRGKSRDVLASYFGKGSIHKLHHYALRLLQLHHAGDEKRIFIARLVTALGEFADRLKALLQRKSRWGKDELRLLEDLGAFLETSRSILQKKDLGAALATLQEVKDIRITIKDPSLKDCYDGLNAILQHIIEIVI
jgi:phosphate uptake regulator